MYLKIASVFAAILISSTIIAGQENQALTQAQRVVLDTPEVIALKLAPITRRAAAGGYEKVTGPFNLESKIRFVLVATNTSIIPLDVRSWDTYAQNRPRLMRDNQEVAYRDAIKDLAKDKDKEDGDIIHMFLIRLEPNAQKILENLDLSDWYEPLPPGHYELSTQHRFLQGGKWVDASPIVFEVEKKR